MAAAAVVPGRCQGDKVASGSQPARGAMCRCKAASAARSLTTWSVDAAFAASQYRGAEARRLPQGEKNCPQLAHASADLGQVPRSSVLRIFAESGGGNARLNAVPCASGTPKRPKRRGG